MFIEIRTNTFYEDEIIGKKNAVRTLINAEISPGIHQVNWNGDKTDGTPVVSGVYISQLSSVSLTGRQSFRETKKLLLLK